MANHRNNHNHLNLDEMPAGVIGLGLMGHSIIACLLSAGHPVIAVTRNLSEHRDSRRRIRHLLEQLRREELAAFEPAALMKRVRLTERYEDLSHCGIVVESVLEDLEAKREAYRRVESVVPARCIIGSNTSSIPVTVLQAGAMRPERFVGIHWDEPAHVTRFMEIIAGEKTAPRCVKRIMALAKCWGKEASLLRRDVRGFITNRISYAMFREACHLVDSGIATVEDVDRSLRNDVGWWIPFAGPFRYMDLMGPYSYYRVMKDLLPELSTSADIPKLMRDVVESGGRGIANGRGFYKYSEAEAKRWEKRFLEFNYDVRRLALKYPSDAGAARRAPKSKAAVATKKAE